MLYRLIRAYFRIAMRLYYSAIEVEGLERVPSTGPLLILSNHPNALIDPLAAVIDIDRQVSFTAKSTLGRIPGIGWLLKTVGAVTFHRQQDVGDGASLRGNLATFKEIHARLADGGAVLIFPEGRTHGEPRLSRFKRGTARIALSYVEAGDVGGLMIVPVGLTFEDPARYRSRVHVRYGLPMRVAEWAAQHRSDDNTLTRELMRRVGECTLQFETEEEAARFLNAAAIVQADEQAPPTRGLPAGTLGQRIDMAKRLQVGAEALVADNGAASLEVDALVKRVDRYRARLDALGLEPSEVFLSMSPLLALRFTVRELAIVLLGLPVAVFAAAVHAVPFILTRIVARRLAQTEDQYISGVIFSGFVAFPLTYLVASALALWRLPPYWAAAFILFLLPSMAFTVRYRSRLEAALRRSRTFIRFSRNRGLKAELAEEGKAINRKIRELEGPLQSLSATPIPTENLNV